MGIDGRECLKRRRVNGNRSAEDISGKRILDKFIIKL